MPLAVVLSALAEGLDPSAAERFFRTLWLPHLQLDELRTRLRNAKQILWLGLAIDPLTKIPRIAQRDGTCSKSHKIE